jgi:two-component system LytT family response regulator
MKIRAVVIDDEPPARRRVRQLLNADPDVEVIAECGDGEAAVATICDKRPDLVFLDVQMPEMDGFEVVKRVGVDRMPVTVFVTAYDRYALRAFEAHALDYLLKPFGKARLAEALRRAKQHIAGNLNREALRSVVAMLDRAAGQNNYPARLPVTQQGHVLFVNTAEIDWIEADGNYARLHVGNHPYEVRETLTSIEQKLNPQAFVRIHRSTIVNVSSIKEIHPWFRGHHLVILKSGQELRMSRYKHDAARQLGVG